MPKRNTNTRNSSTKAKDTALRQTKKARTSRAPIKEEATTKTDNNSNGKKEIELCISFDTTGSMFPCLGEVKRKVKELIKRLQKDVSGIKIALIAHGDYGDEGSAYLMKNIDFSTKSAALQKFTENAGPTCGYDCDEAYEYVLREAQKLSWSPRAESKQRVLVMIGDANPHPLKSNNPYDIEWRAEAGKLKDMGVRVHAVHALARPHSRPFYEELAQTTGGHYLELDQFASIRDLIVSVAYAENSREQLARFENEVMREGRMTRSMTRMFDKLQDREESPLAAVPEDLAPVPIGRFQILDVDKRMPIKEFVKSRDLIFKTGRGFYFFNKPEKISLKKEIVLRCKRTGDMFTGKQAQEMLGITEASADFRIEPSSFKEYWVFVQSTSYNRVLLPRTKFLYEVDAEK